MKASIQRRRAIQWIGVGPKLLVLCLGLLVAGSARADLVVEGRKLPWTATIPSGWVGGTAEKIEEILAKGGTDSGKRKLDEILRHMVAESKKLDAIFFHLDAETETKTLSSLRVNVIALNLESLADEVSRESFWSAYAELVAKDFPAGAKVEVARDRSATTGGRKAYEATFVATLPGKGKVYTVLHVVAYTAGQTHIFRLQADSQKFPARFAELEKILSSLKYRSE